MEKTAENLRSLRKMTGMSMKKAADLSDTPYATWAGWEAPVGSRNKRRAPGLAFAWLSQMLSAKMTFHQDAPVCAAGTVNARHE